MGEVKNLIEQHLIENPILNRGERGCYDVVAEYFEVSTETVRSIYRNLRRKGLVPDTTTLVTVESVCACGNKCKDCKSVERLRRIAEIQAEKARYKTKLFFDIEVSPNIVLAWRAGYDLNINHDDIIQERAIICVCYKWEHEDVVHSLEWDNGDDRQLLEEFSKIIDSADEVVGQNSDRFDIKWLRTRCLFHRIPISPKFYSIDTLKFAKAGFNFNSNKLDYMGKFLGLGEKIHTDLDLWKRILLYNDKQSLKDMVTYCKQDVNLLEKVYNELKLYVPEKKFKYPKI